MKERPILFSSPTIRAILEGRKTQTRRVVKHITALGEPDNWCPRMAKPEIVQIIGDFRAYCPYGQIGDRLWVRETHWIAPTTKAVFFREGENQRRYVEDRGYKWRPSIHMPRWASRITLEVTGVRVERVNQISEADALAEGCAINLGYTFACAFNEKFAHHTARGCFNTAWNCIHGPEHFEKTNPWVWVVEFTNVTTTAGNVGSIPTPSREQRER